MTRDFHRILTAAAEQMPPTELHRWVEDPEVTEGAREILRARIRVLEGDLFDARRQLSALGVA